ADRGHARASSQCRGCFEPVVGPVAARARGAARDGGRQDERGHRAVAVPLDLDRREARERHLHEAAPARDGRAPEGGGGAGVPSERRRLVGADPPRSIGRPLQAAIVSAILLSNTASSRREGPGYPVPATTSLCTAPVMRKPNAWASTLVLTRP